MEGLIFPGVDDDLVIPIAFAWPSPDRLVEAIGDSAQKRAQRANRAAQDVIKDRHALERATTAQIQKRLDTLRDALQRRLLATSVTDFRAFTIRALAADVDRLIAHSSGDIAADADKDFKAAAELGVSAATEPMSAAQLSIPRAVTGLATHDLVQAAFDNTVDLLTPPMAQYAAQIKRALRATTLAGDNKFGAIQDLADSIAGDGFSGAQFKAERIIRTEVGRVFNAATFTGLSDLSDDFPFIRKGWHATGDSRTRRGHQEAGDTYGRGQGIPIADRFVVNVYQESFRKPTKKTKSGGARAGGRLIGVAHLRFPSDPQTTPGGRVAAGATIMCRCNAFVDFEMTDFASFAADKISMALGGR